jgi:hypothetical protein
MDSDQYRRPNPAMTKKEFLNAISNGKVWEKWGRPFYLYIYRFAAI